MGVMDGLRASSIYEVAIRLPNLVVSRVLRSHIVRHGLPPAHRAHASGADGAALYPIEVWKREAEAARRRFAGKRDCERCGVDVSCDVYRRRGHDGRYLCSVCQVDVSELGEGCGAWRRGVRLLALAVAAVVLIGFVIAFFLVH
jgi:hypothetical protein